MSNPLKYWANTNSSSHRGNERSFYIANAQEHISIIDVEERKRGLIDLGCGAGKLLQYYLPQLNVKAGLDFSSSMLAEAEITMNNKIELIHANPFEYLPDCQIPIWTTTEALNQYLQKDEIKHLLTLFKKNKFSEAFYLFETICPLRYPLLGLGISFRKEHLTTRNVLQRLKTRCRYAFNLILGRYSGDMVYLGTPTMGYAYSAHFWLKLAKELNLNVEIIGSRFYEYRYHVIIKKQRACDEQ